MTDSIALVACNIWTTLDKLTVNLDSLGGYSYNPFVWRAWEPSPRSIDPVAWMVFRSLSSAQHYMSNQDEWQTNVSDIPPAIGFEPAPIQIDGEHHTLPRNTCTHISLLDQCALIESILNQSLLTVLTAF